MRELCVQIERTKESLARQLASQSVSHDQTCSDIADITAERDLLKQQVMSCTICDGVFECTFYLQLTNEQAKSENLEALLTRQRRKV